MLARVLEIARDASTLVLGVYQGEFDVEYKGKNDPVTSADRAANLYIARALGEAFPGIPIVAEESDPASFAGFEVSAAAFFVDPLDGTREFVARNDQFAVMIGLAEEGRATLGVVTWPSLRRSFGGAEGRAFEVRGDGEHVVDVSRTASLEQARVVISRSRHAEGTAAAIARLGASKVERVGSAGVKGGLVACGEADIYVHVGVAGKRWDTCAPEAIVRAAGGMVSDATGAEIDYRAASLVNASGIVMTNGLLHRAVIERITER
jgi:3'(2'), 5'-bisphosphate nucleotidase